MATSNATAAAGAAASAAAQAAASGAPGSAAPSALSWSDQDLQAMNILQDFQNTPVLESDLVTYGGKIMSAQAAQAQYQADLESYNNSAKGAGLTAAEKAAKNQNQFSAANSDIAGPNIGTSGPIQPEGGPGTQPQAPALHPTISAVVNQQLTMMDPGQLTNLQRQMQAAGFLGQNSYKPGVPDAGTVEAFASLLAETNAAHVNDPSATWASVLNGAISQSGWTVSANGDMTKTTQKTPTLDPIGAQAGFQSAIGRDGSPGEIQNFIAAYAKIMAANPLDATQTITRAGDTVNTAPTYAQQAQTVQQAELEAAQQNPDYATYQAATTYWNAMQQALGAQGNVENNLR